MSIYYDMMEPFTMLDKRTISDGYGGVITKWVEGAEFEASAAKNDTIEVRIALQSGVKDVYNICTRKNVMLQYNDVVLRKSDGRIFRITADAKDSETPKGSAIDGRRASAEEWVIPDDS